MLVRHTYTCVHMMRLQNHNFLQLDDNWPTHRQPWPTLRNICARRTTDHKASCTVASYDGQQQCEELDCASSIQHCTDESHLVWFTTRHQHICTVPSKLLEQERYMHTHAAEDFPKHLSEHDKDPRSVPRRATVRRTTPPTNAHLSSKSLNSSSVFVFFLV